MADVPEMVESEDTDVKIPRPPSGAAPYERVMYEIEVERFRREKEDAALVKRFHNHVKELVALREDFVELRTTVIGADGDDGRMGRMKETVDEMKIQLGATKEAAEKAAQAAAGWWKWALGQFVAVGLLVLVGWIAFRVTEEHRITQLEGEFTNAMKTLDRFESWLDRQGAPPLPSPPMRGSTVAPSPGGVQ